MARLSLMENANEAGRKSHQIKSVFLGSSSYDNKFLPRNRAGKIEVSCNAAASHKAEIKSSETNASMPTTVNSVIEVKNNGPVKLDKQGKRLFESKVKNFMAGSLIGGGTFAAVLSFVMTEYIQNTLLNDSLFLACSVSAAVLSGSSAVKLAGNEIFQKSWKFGALVGICIGAWDPAVGACSAYLSGAIMAITLKVKKPKETEGNDGRPSL